MMRWLLVATLIFSGELYADSLRVTASADTYILDQRNVASTAGSFTITSANAADISFTSIQGTSGQEGRNYGGATTLTIGFITANWRWLLRFDTMDDSMRNIAGTTKSIRWDSARITLTENAAITSGDSITLALYELRSARRFGEGSANAAVGEGASWYNYDSTGGVASTWTTVGCESDVSDFHNILLDTSATLTNATTAAGNQISLKVPGTSISDTVNNAGFYLQHLRIGNNDGASSLAFRSDDNATAGSRPSITVYYTEMEYPDFGGADTLLMKTTNPATTIGYPVMTFDISTVTATADLDSAKLWMYVNANYSDNGEVTVDFKPSVAMKPINVGTGTGVATATGKMHWASWYENGVADSAWGIIGAMDIGAVCNRSTATGDDKTNDTASATYYSSGTGWKRMMVDTVAVRAYLNGTCANFAVIVQPSAAITDDAWYVCSSVEGANDPFLVIYYTPAASGATKGTGRFGRANDGRYLNVR